jgi:hypothetical protein
MWIQDGLWSCEVNHQLWLSILRAMSSFFIAEIGKLNLQCPKFFGKVIKTWPCRAWGASTFGTDNRLTNPQQGPIKQATLMLLNPIDGTVSNEAGASM